MFTAVTFTKIVMATWLWRTRPPCYRCEASKRCAPSVSFPTAPTSGSCTTRYWGYAFSATLILLTLILVPLKGLNFGVDFRGGLLIEVRVPRTTADLATGTVGAWGTRPGRSVAADVQRQRRPDPGATPGGRRGRAEGRGREGQVGAERAFGDVSYRRSSRLAPRSAPSCCGRALRPWSTPSLRSWPTSGSASEWQYGVGAILALIHDRHHDRHLLFVRPGV